MTVLVFFNNYQEKSYYDATECNIIKDTLLSIIQEKKKTFINLVNIKSFVIEE